jgi:sugar/nucleoside kinase (ribokinase family)
MGRLGLVCSFTVDRVITHGETAIRPGGPALYSALAAAFMKTDSTLYTQIGFDFDQSVLERLEKVGVNTSMIKSDHSRLTPFFTLVYSGGTRKIFLCGSNTLDKYYRSVDIQESNIYISFTHNELNESTLYNLVQSKKTCIDIQGFVRKANSSGLVGRVHPTLELNYFTYIKFSHDEVDKPIQFVHKALNSKVEEVIVTKGRLGAEVYTRSEKYVSPPAQIRTIGDPTGAGDVFTLTYFNCRVSGESIEQSMAKATVNAGLTPELRKALQGRLLKVDDYETLYEKIKKMIRKDTFY